ncbi:hypothetical protein [Paracoccus sp. NBH48]|uniref:hypothetical protein n=1 Tax=Paracoccus sp. NBH48 TaxID=2596918 RepID=UPI001890F867|nr:hypothetical protein [Paracoccus sp. NBH48]
MTDEGLQGLGQDAPHAPGGVLIQTSSGTTGAPKIIARSWAAIQTEIDAYLYAFPQAAGMTPVIAAPITHSYGLIAGVLVGQARGHAPVVLDHANPRAILRQLAPVPRSADLCRTAAAACAGAVGRGAGTARGDVVGTVLRSRGSTRSAERRATCFSSTAVPRRDAWPSPRTPTGPRIWACPCRMSAFRLGGTHPAPSPSMPQAQRCRPAIWA